MYRASEQEIDSKVAEPFDLFQILVSIKVAQVFFAVFLVSPIHLFRCVLNRFHSGMRLRHPQLQGQPRQLLAIQFVPSNAQPVPPAPNVALPAALPALPAALPVRLPAPVPMPLPRPLPIPLPIPMPLPMPLPLQPPMPHPMPQAPNDDLDDDNNDDGTFNTPRRRRRTDLELLTGGIRTPDLDRSLRLRQPPQRFEPEQAPARRQGARRGRGCRDCKTRLENLFKNANLI